MHREVLLAWLAGLFAAMASVLVLAAVVVGWPVVFVALPLAGMAALLWYHASGRLTRRMRRRARRRPRGASDPAPRSAATGPRGRSPPEGDAGARTGRRRRATADRRRATAGRTPPGADPSAGMSPERARSVLGLSRDASPDAIRAAYRKRVKEVHPDRGGDEDAFKRVTEAYETLGEPS